VAKLVLSLPKYGRSNVATCNRATLQLKGAFMDGKLLDQFRQQEADNIALSLKFNRWSLVMIELMIREQEQKLVASDLPVDGDGEPDFFWHEFS
jgi:hypothetical protein